MKHSVRATTRILAGVVMLALGLPALGAELDDLLRVAAEINSAAAASQDRVDKITAETRSLLDQYRVVLKEIEGLRVYNAQMQRQIDSQEREMATLNESIDKVTVIQRQITPLMTRMIDGLEKFVALDIPFLAEERTDRVERLREMMDRANVAVSEKFSQVLGAYQIENDYGRTMESYVAQIDVDGSGTPRSVNILRVGRVALVYQTPDAALAGVWDRKNNRWQPLSGDWRNKLRHAFRVAKKQEAVSLLELPIPGPEALQR